jgi:hypothetical protein
MKAKITDYITQRSTWCGIGAALLVVIAYAQPEWTTVAAGVLAALGLSVTDKKS